MNLKIILSLIALVFICAPGTDKKNSLEEQNLNGDVKTLKEFWYDPVVQSGTITRASETPNQSFMSSFDENGNQIDMKYYSGGNLYFEMKYTYDAKGHLIADQKYNERGDLKEENRYTYDAKGNKSEKHKYRYGDFKGKVVYTYDDMGLMIEESTYGSDDLLQSKSTYKYDDKGNNTEGILYDSKGNLDTKFTQRYDEDNHMIEAKSYDEEDQVIDPVYSFTYEFENNDNGNWIKKIMFSNGSQNTYNGLGHLIEENSDVSPNAVLLVEREIDYY